MKFVHNAFQFITRFIPSRYTGAEPEQPDVLPAPPVTAVTSPAVRRLLRSTARKTTRYNEYISAICELAKTLCKIELLHHVCT